MVFKERHVVVNVIDLLRSHIVEGVTSLRELTSGVLFRVYFVQARSAPKTIPKVSPLDTL